MNCNVKYAKAVSNGTTALHLAYLAIGVRQGDIVWTSPNTFVATANAALYCGAEVDFVDITWLLNKKELEEVGNWDEKIFLYYETFRFIRIKC